MLGVGIDLGGIGILESQHVAGKLHYAHLHSQADSKERNLVLTCILYGIDLTLKAA